MKSLLFPMMLFAATPTLSSGPAYRSETETWRAEREARLRAPDGWLTLVGLFWLRPGQNRFGGAPDDDVRLPASVPPHVGSFVLEGRSVRLVVPSGSQLKLNAAPAVARTIKTDAAGAADVLALGSVSWSLIERGERIGVRARDADNPLRRTWPGSSWYAIDPAYRVVARLEPRAGATNVVVPDASGGKQTLKSPGTLVFALGGQTLRLDPVLDGDDDADQLIVFRDLTSGRETYGGGRFARARRQADGTFVVDFNRAYAPPCAFTPYATCPLPPAQNRLRVSVPAGERTRVGEDSADRRAHR